MNLTFHTQALAILFYLQKAGYEAYIVGGAVRDIFLRAGITEDDVRRTQIKSYDYDFTTNATPEQILTVFPEAFYENDFGTVSLPDEDLQETLQQRGIEVEIIPAVEEDTETVVGSTGSPPDKKPRIIDLAKATKIHESLIERDLPEDEDMIEQEVEAQQAARTVISDLDKQNFEITTYRSDEVYDGDFRRPTQMQWGKSIMDDLGRRDLTINALAVKVNQKWLQEIFADRNEERATGETGPNLPARLNLTTEQAELIDAYEGLADLQAGVIRCVGVAAERFTEDALRMLRAIRFSVQLNFEIEEQTWQALIDKAELIKHVSWERIRDELLRMLASPEPAQAIIVMDQTGILDYVLPELVACKDVEQNGHHETDVWTHAVDALYYCPSPDPIVRLAALLHDVGKPVTAKKIDGQWTFYNHQHVGARLARQIGRRLRLSRSEVERLVNLVRHHMFHYQPHDSDAAVRRLMREVGLENLDDLLALREGDRLGSGSKQTSWRLEELKARMIEQLHQPMDVRDLKINGYDLMNELGLKPGRELGEILDHLLELVLDEAELNERAVLLEKAREYLEKIKREES